jgi:type II secretory pathway component PulK
MTATPVIARRRPDPFESQRGSMLILALIVVFLMTVLASDITEVSMVEYEASANVGKIVRLEYALNAALEVAKAHLVQDGQDTDIDSLQDSWAQPIKITLGGKSAESVEERASDQAPGGVDVTIEIEDEESKWPLALCVLGGSNDAQKRKRREFLSAVIDSYRENYGAYDLDRATADRWAEAISAFLARSETEGGPVPRPATKSDVHILNVADLSLIKDLDDKALFDELNEKGELVPGLLRYLTIWSDLKVNINTAPLPVLRGLFRPEDRTSAETLYNHRTAQTDENEKKKDSTEARLEEQTKGKGGKDGKDDEDRTGGAIFEKVQDIQKIEGIAARTYTEASQMMAVSSKTFSVWATAELGSMSRTRHWVLRRESGRVVIFLSEAVDQDYRPRFRKTRPDEEEGGGGRSPQSLLGR